MTVFCCKAVKLSIIYNKKAKEQYDMYLLIEPCLIAAFETRPDCVFAEGNCSRCTQLVDRCCRSCRTESGAAREQESVHTCNVRTAGEH